LIIGAGIYPFPLSLLPTRSLKLKMHPGGMTVPSRTAAAKSALCIWAADRPTSDVENPPHRYAYPRSMPCETFTEFRVKTTVNSAMHRYWLIAHNQDAQDSPWPVTGEILFAFRIVSSASGLGHSRPLRKLFKYCNAFGTFTGKCANVPTVIPSILFDTLQLPVADSLRFRLIIAVFRIRCIRLPAETSLFYT